MEATILRGLQEGGRRQAHLPRHVLHPPRLPRSVQKADRRRIARERAVGEGIDVEEVESGHEGRIANSGRPGINARAVLYNAKSFIYPSLVPGRNYLPGVFGYACRDRGDPQKPQKRREQGVRTRNGTID
jgi:hypothetical protein